MSDQDMPYALAGEEIPFGSPVWLVNAEWRVAPIEGMQAVAARPRWANRIKGSPPENRTSWLKGEAVDVITDTDIPFLFPFRERHRFPSGRVHLAGEQGMVRMKGGRICE